MTAELLKRVAVGRNGTRTVDHARTVNIALAVEERCRLAKFLMRRRKAVIDAHARATGRA